VINLDSQSEETPFSINEFVHNIAAAPPGRLYIADGPGDNDGLGYGGRLYLARAADGKVLATMSGEDGGAGAIPQAGGCYYFADPLSWGSLTKYDVSRDNFQQVTYISSYDKVLPGVVVSADGSRVFWNGTIYDQNLKKLLTLGESILAASRDGEMAFSATQVYATRDGRQLATLPAGVKTLGLTGDEQKLFTWDGSQLTAVWTQAMQVALAQPQRPQPADQAFNIPLYLEQLAWEPSPGATSYDVYWGTSRDRVAAASKSSPEFIGTTLGPPFYVKPYQLSPGQTAWWRVDAVGPFGVSKGVAWSYTAVAMEAYPPLWDPFNPQVPFPAEQTFRLDWSSNISAAGDFLRFELWKRSAGMVAYLGLGWSSATGSGSKSFYMPLVPSGDDYFIRVTSTANPLLVSDTQTFSIQGAAIRLQAPNGGERWPALTKQPINWKANTFFAGTALRFELWKTSGKVADLGTAYDPDGEGLFYITVPMVPTRGDYRIRAISVWDPSLYDESDGTLTILGSGPERSAVPSRIWQGYQ
jgi:hypothetical protein